MCNSQYLLLIPMSGIVVCVIAYFMHENLRYKDWLAANPWKNAGKSKQEFRAIMREFSRYDC